MEQQQGLPLAHIDKLLGATDAKEAMLKAHGQGISFGLHRLQLAPANDGALHLRWCDPELGEAARWHLHEWQASGQFRAALAWYPQ